jgi:hypothetical protein
VNYNAWTGPYKKQDLCVSKNGPSHMSSLILLREFLGATGLKRGMECAI